MFKVGDRVLYEPCNMGIIVEIDTDIMPEIPYRVEFENGNHQWLGDEDLRSAKPCDNCKTDTAAQTLLELHLCSTCYRAVIAWASGYSKEMEAVIGG